MYTYRVTLTDEQLTYVLALVNKSIADLDQSTQTGFLNPADVAEEIRLADDTAFALVYEAERNEWVAQKGQV